MASAADFPSTRSFRDQDGAFHTGGAAFFNGDETDISAQLDVLDSVVAAELVFLDGAVIGTATASKCVVANSSGAVADPDLILESTNEINVTIGGVGLLALDDAAIASNAAATDTAGKACYVETQDAGATPTTAKAGGLLNMKTGDGADAANAVACGPGGALVITTGDGGANTGAGSGEVGGAGGALTITTGPGGTTDSTGAHAGGAGGALTISTGVGGTQTGAAQTGGAGGDIAITGAAGGAVSVASATGGAGATVTVTAGAGGAASGGSDTGGEGGDLLLVSGAGGTGATAGVAGNVISRGQTFLQKKLDDPMGAAATISTAELLGGIIVATPTGDGDAYTTPTGAEISALFGTTPTVGDSFELTIINVAATNKTVELTAGATGMTVTGEATIENVTDGVAAGVASSGTFIFVNTDANVWVAYRK